MTQTQYENIYAAPGETKRFFSPLLDSKYTTKCMHIGHAMPHLKQFQSQQST